MNIGPGDRSLEIVIAEDSPTQAERLKYILEEYNGSVVVTRNGRDALERIRARKPDLLITDVNMPEMNGYELCSHIRAEEDLTDLPVILLTSLSDTEDVYRAVECGADSFITKPYDESSLVSQIQMLLASTAVKGYGGRQKHTSTIESRAGSLENDRILNLLLSTYSAAIQKNRQLSEAHNALAQLNEQLEEKVRARTSSLQAAMAERKHAMEKIEEQAALLDKTQDAIVLQDLEGRTLFWNSGAERIYGWKKNEVIDQKTLAHLLESRHANNDIKTVIVDKGEWSGELEHITKDQRHLIVEVRSTLLRDQSGEPRSILSIITDITERKQIEAQIVRAQRMESIGTLSAGIAHDLNNILAPIMLSIEILKTGDPKQDHSILETIELSAKRGADIVKQVLSFARGIEGQRVEVQPTHLIRDLETIIRDTFPKDIQLRLSVAKDTWPISGDPTQLHQILLNLCVNARDAMPSGGILTISTENKVLDEHYVAMNSQAATGKYLVISVVDSGTGIPPGIIDRIFEPFFTTKEIGKGTGLGLSTVMAITKSHGGFVNVYSEVGKGTTFRIYLPAISGSSVDSGVTNTVHTPRGNGEKILVIDDEASILAITSQTLSSFGYRVVTAKNGAEALGVYAEEKHDIAAVLTDMAMPVLDGVATAHALMKMNPAVKIIAVSGLSSSSDEPRLRESGVRCFLQKPYTSGALLRALRTILDEG